MRPSTIRYELEFECSKQIRRYSRSLEQSRRQHRRFYNRTYIPPAKPKSYKPSYWGIHRAFDPFYVRKRIDQFAHAISKRIESGDYEPHPAVQIPIPKPGGGERTVSISSVPDAAVSRWLYRRMIAKNLSRLSPYAFAYRPDRRVGHAIEHIHGFVRLHPRLFAVEYDFKSYFDTISHEYLLRLVDIRMSIGARERRILAHLLRGRYADPQSYESGCFEKRRRGIAQGSCLSLFLANLACIELDESLEKTGSCYARFADDTVVLCPSYSQAAECAAVLHNHKNVAGIALNYDKSPGITLLTEEPSSEIRGKRYVRFLGHEVHGGGVELSLETARKIKAKLAKTLYRHLLLYPSRQDYISEHRIDLPNRIDWDLVTCINEIRKYVYGQMSDAQVAGEDRVVTTRQGLGVMSFFASVTIGDRFRSLDGWLVNAITRCLAERRRRLWNRFEIQAPLLTTADLISGAWYEHEIENDTRIPSFFSAWKAVRRISVSQGCSSLPDVGYDENLC